MEADNLIKNKEERNWGDIPLIQSDTSYNIKFLDFQQLETLEDNTLVNIRARVQSKRGKGNCCFLQLRQSYYTVQAVAFKSNEVPKKCV